MTADNLPVFVYGTLRPGEKNYERFLDGRTIKVIRATAEGHLFYVADGGYPYMEPGRGRVTGDLVYLHPECYEDTLRQLDELEEYEPAAEFRSVYLRRRTIVKLVDGSSAAAWIYYWNDPQTVGVRIASGDFRDRPN